MIGFGSDMWWIFSTSVLIDFPVFNVADIYVTVSFAVLLLLVFFQYKEEDLEFFGKKKGTSADGE